LFTISITTIIFRCVILIPVHRNSLVRSYHSSPMCGPVYKSNQAVMKVPTKFPLTNDGKSTKPLPYINHYHLVKKHIRHEGTKTRSLTVFLWVFVPSWQKNTRGKQF